MFDFISNFNNLNNTINDLIKDSLSNAFFLSLNEIKIIEIISNNTFSMNTLAKKLGGI